MNLYWVTTEDHHEDWFIIAPSSKQACKFYENYEGYNPGDANAEKILAIPKDISAETGWPSEELLISLGAKFIRKGHQRVVEIKGRKFSEGMLELLINEICDDEFEKHRGDRPNETKKLTKQ